MQLKLGISIAAVGALSIAALASLNVSNLSHTQSPYVTQIGSSIRGLSTQEINDLLNGRGAGYARTAELNSYPGPRHVLDLRQELVLSSEQEQQIEAIFRQMNTEAKQVGQNIVELERKFSNAFAQRTISESEIEEQTQELAMLYGQYRVIHLQPHLEVQRLLSPEQIAKYDELRGYSDASVQPTPNSPAHHH
ncbi:Spy/CpxP family protein refolding chaperone [Leptolyngbya sp. GB1-A1]|uniref:Spy/CpxP family protein refolding chaperone n=1 Tax=Leptolyngbya sp. GB1-A1 TaxID=2933908 RepID=UPI003298234C